MATRSAPHGVTIRARAGYGVVEADTGVSTNRRADLTFGTDFRGDRAFLLHRRHFVHTARDDAFYALDARAARAAGPGIVFFRLIDEDGRETSAHGFIENGHVVQWG